MLTAQRHMQMLAMSDLSFAACPNCICAAVLDSRYAASQGDKSLKQLGWRLAAKPVVRPLSPASS